MTSMSCNIKLYATFSNELLYRLRASLHRICDTVVYLDKFRFYVLRHSKYRLYPRHALHVLKAVEFKYRVEYCPTEEFWFHNNQSLTTQHACRPFSYYYSISNKYIANIFRDIVANYSSRKAYFKTLFVDFHTCWVSCTHYSHS